METNALGQRRRVGGQGRPPPSPSETQAAAEGDRCHRREPLPLPEDTHRGATEEGHCRFRGRPGLPPRETAATAATP